MQHSQCSTTLVSIFKNTFNKLGTSLNIPKKKDKVGKNLIFVQIMICKLIIINHQSKNVHILLL